jgi:hypothetical protein
VVLSCWLSVSISLGAKAMAWSLSTDLAATAEVDGLEADLCCQTGAQRIVTQRCKDLGLGCQRVSERRHASSLLTT